MHRICTSLKDYLIHSLDMASQLLSRGYPRDIVLSGLLKAALQSRVDLLCPRSPPPDPLVYSRWVPQNSFPPWQTLSGWFTKTSLFQGFLCQGQDWLPPHPQRLVNILIHIPTKRYRILLFSLLILYTVLPSQIHRPTSETSWSSIGFIDSSLWHP